MKTDRLHQILFLMDVIVGSFDPSRKSCPACGGSEVEFVASKKLMKLVRCKHCSLLFRTPSDRIGSNTKFYQKMYVEGPTTRMPSDETLEKLKGTNFKSMQKDFSRWIRLLKCYSVGGRLLDYGCSWGYGAWQFAQAGYDVSGFEVSRPRGKYAGDKLGIDVFFKESDLPDNIFDIVFTSHVIEHVPNPIDMIQTIRRVLKPNGVCFGLTPNGSTDYKNKNLTGWMNAWGRKHAMYLDVVFMQKALFPNQYLITSDLSIEKFQRWLAGTTSFVSDTEESELVFAFKKA